MTWDTGTSLAAPTTTAIHSRKWYAEYAPYQFEASETGNSTSHNGLSLLIRDAETHQVAGQVLRTKNSWGSLVIAATCHTISGTPHQTFEVGEWSFDAAAQWTWRQWNRSLPWHRRASRFCWRHGRKIAAVAGPVTAAPLGGAFGFGLEVLLFIPAAFMWAWAADS